MSHGRWLGVLLLGGLATLAAALWLGRTPTPEELVRERVIQMAHAAEEKQLGFLMEQLSTRFRSAEGWTREDLKGVLAAQLLRGAWVRVFPAQLEVRDQPPHQVQVSATFLLGRSTARELRNLVRDTDMQAEAIEATFEREADGEWRVVTAQHRALTQEEVLRRTR